MRKKTIEEELKEIQSERDDYISELEKEYGHSTDHRYNFTSEEKSKESERNHTVHGVKVTKEEYEQWQNDFSQDSKFEAKTEQARNELSEVKKEVDITKSVISEDKEFTEEDYKRMIMLEESELSDEEFDEYCELCDRYGEINKRKQDKFAKLYSDLLTQSNITNIGTPISSSQTTSRTSISSNIKHPSGSLLVPIFFLCIFVFAGICVMTFAGVIPWIQSNDYISVTGTVQAIQDTWHDDSYLYAKVLVSYEYEEESYVRSVNTKVTGPINIGSNITIYVHKKNPTQVKASNDKWFIFPTFFGLVFAGIAIFIQVMFFKQMLKTKRQYKATN